MMWAISLILLLVWLGAELRPYVLRSWSWIRRGGVEEPSGDLTRPRAIPFFPRPDLDPREPPPFDRDFLLFRIDDDGRLEQYEVPERFVTAQMSVFPGAKQGV